jgi:hypothetical protein
MSRIRNALTTTAILVGSSAALLTGGIARADTAPAPPPAIPGLNMFENLINPANAPQLLQAAASVLTGAQAAPVTPVTPPSLATASVTLPQQPAATVPGAAAFPGIVPGAATLPGIVPPTVPAATVPAATAPATVFPGIMPATPPATPVANGLIPTGELTLPSVPGLPIPLPQRLAFPGDLASLLPGSPGAAVSPGAAATAPGIIPAAAATSPMPGLGALFPTAALP